MKNMFIELFTVKVVRIAVLQFVITVQSKNIIILPNFKIFK